MNKERIIKKFKRRNNKEESRQRKEINLKYKINNEREEYNMQTTEVKREKNRKYRMKFGYTRKYVYKYIYKND